MNIDNSKVAVYISLGSNLGERQELLKQAIERIQESFGKIQRKASIYESAPVGYQSENNYLNTVIVIYTDKTPIEILNILMKIEQQLGRTRLINTYSDRTIDLDILIYKNFDFNIKTQELTVPHPRMLNRDFVIIPLLEIADPQLKAKIEEELSLQGIIFDQNSLRLMEL